ncbi:MAG TPA: Fis family transcriptional regulator [Anaeromyxobacteraceae bacterium]|jgi:hypothetical protein|nr:Fis family transcriptional regulator [Anaeromyxobacteraceae bacterium]
MAELDDELIARVIDWCTEAGRRATPAEVRAALAPLGWDELLAARALLADPPPARPLGPGALADLARGVAPEAAAAAERQGHPQASGEPPPEQAEAGQKPPRRGRKRRGQPTAPVIRRARDRVAAPVSSGPSLPLLDELRRSEGRAVLERLLRRVGARRKALLAALAEGWRRPEGALPAGEDLQALLEHHGLARAFERRERELLLHALRAAGGVAARAAASLDLGPEEFGELLSRAGAEQEAGRIRAERGREVLRQATTISERVRLLLGDEERLADLGVLPTVLADLRARLPEHLRALRASTPARYLTPALARSLSVPRVAAEALARRFALQIAPPVPGSAPRVGAPRPTSQARAPRAGPPGPARGSPRAGPRPGSPAPAPRGRPPGAGPARPRSGEGHVIEPTPGRAQRPSSDRPRPPGRRPGSPRGASRPGAPRSSAPGPKRPAGPRRPR